MPRFHSVDGVLTQFTPEEEVLFDKEAAAWEAGAPARAAKDIQDNRKASYETESDHLFFEEQRGEVPEGTWAAKVAEIKNRFPK
jgi:hypothetical protein